jgi:hypothetical protein
MHDFASIFILAGAGKIYPGPIDSGQMYFSRIYPKTVAGSGRIFFEEIHVN